MSTPHRAPPPRSTAHSVGCIYFHYCSRMMIGWSVCELYWGRSLLAHFNGVIFCVIIVTSFEVWCLNFHVTRTCVQLRVWFRSVWIWTQRNTAVSDKIIKIRWSARNRSVLQHRVCHREVRGLWRRMHRSVNICKSLPLLDKVKLM